MPARRSWSRGLVIGGLVGMIAGLIDPMEGSVVIAFGSTAAAVGGFVGGSRHRRLLFLAALLTVVGVVTMFGISSVGGFGGDTGRPMWWALILLPYPAGWILGLIGAVRTIRERRPQHPPEPAGA